MRYNIIYKGRGIVLEMMMQVLKTKQNLIYQVKFEDVPKSDEDQAQWLTDIAILLQKEPLFLLMNNRIFFCVKDNLDYIKTDGKVENRYMAQYIHRDLEKIINQWYGNYRLRDDYYQWITLVRTKPNCLELSVAEQLRQARLDYTNMQALLNNQTKNLIGNLDVLSTINYTLTLFPEVYKEEPLLLEESKDMILYGLEQDVDRKYRKTAKRTLKYIEQRERSYQKDQEKRKVKQ